MRLYCYPGYASASSVLYFGLPEWDEMHFVLRYLQDGDRFVDVGANVGVYSLLAATFLEDVSVTAVEPDATTAGRLRENLEVNGARGVHVIECALAARSGTALFTRGRDSTNRIARLGDPDVVEVPVRTLDEVTARLPPKLMKIDVEGAELEVLRGASRLLASQEGPVLLFELNRCCADFGVTPPDIRDHLAGHGYTLFEYDADTNALSVYDGTRLPARGNVVAAQNTAALRVRLDEGARRLGDLSRFGIEIEIERRG
jgi:FkbM family methyltransferase